MEGGFTCRSTPQNITSIGAARSAKWPLLLSIQRSQKSISRWPRATKNGLQKLALRAENEARPVSVEGGVSQANIIERAFQLAPECQSLAEVRNKLQREGYFHVDAHLGSKLLKTEIKQRLNASRPNFR
jgi:osmotically-inducible protein OsmY